METLESFRERREALNGLLLRSGDLKIKRFLALDHDAYEDGALPKKVKELIGLAASAVLRCDDCITYHLGEALEDGASRTWASGLNLIYDAEGYQIYEVPAD